MRSYLGAIAFVFFLTLAVAVYYVHHSIEYHAGQALSFLSIQKTSELSECFGAVERAVHVFENFVLSNVDTEKLKTDKSYAEQFMESFATLAKQPAPVRKYSKTIYFCPDPESFPFAKSVYFLNPSAYPAGTFSNGSGSLTRIPYNLSQFEQNDVGHTAFFFKAKEAQSARWLGPLPNLNVEHSTETLSFAIPLYKGDVFIGVVGMDVSMALLRNLIDNLNYESGFGFLVSKEGNLLYHRDFPHGLSIGDFKNFKELLDLGAFFSDEFIETSKNYAYTWKNEKHRLVISRMENEMLLAISVPETELLKLQSDMLWKMSFLLILVLLTSLFLANAIANKIIRPIQDLTENASRISRGELNTVIEFHSDDEIEALAHSIRKISRELKEYIAYINSLAYSDAMTGCRNKAAYLDKIKELERRISEDMADFTIFVFDVNGLKHMNDSFGHEAGDMLIKDAADVLKSVFGEDCVYRTGGDEFVVLAESIGDSEIVVKNAQFDSKLKSFNSDNDKYEGELAISRGMATFDPQIDRGTKTVFARADEAMYESKKAYYKTHESLRRAF